MQRLLFLLAIFVPAGASAQTLPCPETLCAASSAFAGTDGAEAMVAKRGNDLILAAVAAENEARHQDAGRAYLRATAAVPEAAEYLRQRAARSFLNAGEVGSATAVATGLIDMNLPGSGEVVAAIEFQAEEPDDYRITRALDGPDRERICDTFLAGDAAIKGHPGLFHAWCSGPDEGAKVSTLSYAPTFKERLKRAWRMYGEVRFRAANEEIQNIETDGLTAAQKCELDFITARTTFRLRRRDDAAEIYERVAKNCKDEDLRVRSYYAWGDRRFDTGRMDEAKEAFTAIVENFAHRSHADDAWMYLGRIARDQNDDELAKKALNAVLKNYRDGDMLFEVVWEYLEPLYRAGKYEEFLSEYASLELPDHDDQYYSQGRLEYLAASAASLLGRGAEAQRYWQKAWQKYPWSFYGYLANLRLQKVTGAQPVIKRTSADALPAWMAERPTDRSAKAMARFLRLGLNEHAADVAHMLPTSKRPASLRQARWLAAFSNHRAGRFDFSHNVVRRKIDGRPWVDEEDGPRVQWHLAWPNPFGAKITRANKAEYSQNNPDGEKYVVGDALPTSIMREESSFIEDIESWAGALGLMQLMPRTALGHDDDIEGSATTERLKTADVNIRVGLDHLYWLARRFDSHPVLMVAAYNAGSGAVGKWLRRQPNDSIALFVEDIPYLQTRNYTKRVIGSYAAYQWLSGADQLDTRVLGPAQ